YGCSLVSPGRFFVVHPERRKTQNRGSQKTGPPGIPRGVCRRRPDYSGGYAGSFIYPLGLKNLSADSAKQGLRPCSCARSRTRRQRPWQTIRHLLSEESDDL